MHIKCNINWMFPALNQLMLAVLPSRGPISDQTKSASELGTRFDGLAALGSDFRAMSVYRSGLLYSIYAAYSILMTLHTGAQNTQ